MCDARALALPLGMLLVLSPALDRREIRAQNAVPEPQVRGVELARLLREGGYVVFFHHAATRADQVDTDLTELDRCESQRNLSAEGRKMALQIGHVWKAMGIKVGAVYTSPYCRAKDTAKLAFGGYKVSSALASTESAPREGRSRRSAELKQLLGAAPPPGVNTVIVSHDVNLKEATGVSSKREGDTHVFRPRAGGRFEYVGEAGPQDWVRWAHELLAGAPPPGSAAGR